jgi:hypothetical protein
VTDWLRPQLETIPPALRAQPWLLWRGEDTGGPKPAKVPYCPRAPWRRASSTDPSTWADFATVVQAYSRLPTMSGVGVVLTADAHIACIDLDQALDESGRATSEAVTNIVEFCASWTERSASARGLHIFGYGTLPRAIKTHDGRLEAYDRARYIAMTADRWTATADLVTIQPYLDVLAERFTDRPPPHPPRRATLPPPDDLAGALLADLERWGVHVRRLRPWDTGYLAEIVCPWVDEHTSGAEGTAVIIHGSGARSFVCQHSHCAHRAWRDFFHAVSR